MKIRPPVVLVLLLAVSAVVTVFFWRQISFGRRLDDAELAEALRAESPSRSALHGLNEVTERSREGRPGMDRWTERVVAVSRRPEANVRRAAAWAMQTAAADPGAAARLREMVAADPDETARRNAACSLSLAADPSAARPVLLSMLLPYEVRAPAAGAVESLASVGRRPAEDELVGRLRGADGARIEVVAPVPGRVTEVRAAVGDEVSAGTPLLTLSPDASHMINAARALAVAGAPEDAEALRAALGPAAEFGPDVVREVNAAIEALRTRSR